MLLKQRGAPMVAPPGKRARVKADGDGASTSLEVEHRGGCWKSSQGRPGPFKTTSDAERAAHDNGGTHEWWDAAADRRR